MGAVGHPPSRPNHHFDCRYLGQSSPDGRVNPDGRTIRKLNSSNTRSTGGTGESPETRKANRDARTKHVDPRVKETGTTARIIDDLVPRNLRNVRARIIAGHLSDSDQFWKVNYHWEYLLQMLDHCLTLSIENNVKRDLQGVRSALVGCKPDPPSGYTSGPVGKPEDRSSVEDAHKRHKVLASSKRSFAKITDSAALKSKSEKSGQSFDLAAAPVAPPGTSRHGTGYALDIEGDNSAIKNLCNRLGATLVFDEKSHVHVEFKNGVSGR